MQPTGQGPPQPPMGVAARDDRTELLAVAQFTHHLSVAGAGRGYDGLTVLPGAAGVEGVLLGDAHG